MCTRKQQGMCQIISDGTPVGTRVIAHDGTDLTKLLTIKNIAITVSVGELVKAVFEVEVEDVTLDVKADVEFTGAIDDAYRAIAETQADREL